MNTFINKETVVKKQASLVNGLIASTREFVNSLDKSEIQTILLSGSVARGDYYPGKYGGMVDLTVMKKPGSNILPEQLFGQDEEPDIPYHCVTVDNAHYQILFTEFVDYRLFQTFEEPRKFALMESVLLWDKDDAYRKELEIIHKYSILDIKKRLDESIGYIEYLLSEYKIDRWYRRDAFLQLHENLNSSIRIMIQCLFYKNSVYAPAEDRRLYYSFSLKYVPPKYEELINRLYAQELASESDYMRREKLFRNDFLSFLKERL
ncbi:MAG: hypothetical protein JW875_09740 [Spirochaetales bacterium]|nr:hypothetical protein [Spirochaetales bacterium]